MSQLLDATGRPVQAPPAAQVEAAIRVLAERVNAQFNQIIHLGIFTEWIAKQCEEQGINMNMEAFPAFAKQKYEDLDARFAAHAQGERIVSEGVGDEPIDLSDTTSLTDNA